MKGKKKKTVAFNTPNKLYFFGLGVIKVFMLNCVTGSKGRLHSEFVSTQTKHKNRETTCAVYKDL